jgi:hypothetical protein
MATIDLGLHFDRMRAAVKAKEQQEHNDKQVPASAFPFDRLLMAGEYSTWDLYDQYDEEAFGCLPPIGYKEGEAL